MSAGQLIRPGAALAVLCAVGAGLAGACQRAPELRLVVLIAVDQLRPDRLDAALPGGLGRLMREGRVFSEAALLHATTDTCPGHASMLTGRHPGPIGVPGNRFLDLQTGQKVYCVGDDSEQGRLLGAPANAPGRSPRLIRATALGDWMKAARPASRVYAVSAKDRAAIALGGQHPDAAFWLDLTYSLGFTTSRYYLPALPPWLRPGRDFAVFDSLPARWDHLAGVAARAAPRADDYEPEEARFSRTSGHPLVDEDWRASIERIYFSPFADRVTFAVARELLRREELGRRADPDLLAISLSATDTVGHLYGPESHEALDALLRLDAELADLLDLLEETVGRQHLLVVLTSDHGVLPIPEWLAETGRGECPVASGRIEFSALRTQLGAHLDRSLGASGSPAEPWFRSDRYRFTVNRARAAAAGVGIAEVVAAAKQFLAAQAGVARAWTAQEISEGSGPPELAALYRNSFDPERGGDVAIQPARGCFLSVHPRGTGHGSPYPYDRRVPLLFFGGGVEPGVTAGPAATVDIAPTLAARLGIPAPPDLDGRLLPLHGQPETAAHR